MYVIDYVDIETVQTFIELPKTINTMSIGELEKRGKGEIFFVIDPITAKKRLGKLGRGTNGLNFRMENVPLRYKKVGAYLWIRRKEFGSIMWHNERELINRLRAKKYNIS